MVFECQRPQKRIWNATRLLKVCSLNGMKGVGEDCGRFGLKMVVVSDCGECILIITRLYFQVLTYVTKIHCEHFFLTRFLINPAFLSTMTTL